jgi:hypothetical protein
VGEAKSKSKLRREAFVARKAARAKVTKWFSQWSPLELARLAALDPEMCRRSKEAGFDELLPILDIALTKQEKEKVLLAVGEHESKNETVEI